MLQYFIYGSLLFLIHLFKILSSRTNCYCYFWGWPKLKMVKHCDFSLYSYFRNLYIYILRSLYLGSENAKGPFYLCVYQSKMLYFILLYLQL